MQKSGLKFNIATENNAVNVRLITMTEILTPALLKTEWIAS